MRLPRLLWRFGVMMYLAAIAYLVGLFLLFPRSLAGGYLLLLSSQVALVAIIRGGPRKPFWIALGTLSAAMLAAFTLGAGLLPFGLGWWPQRVYWGYRWLLFAAPPAVTDWLLAHLYVFDPEGKLTVIQMIAVLELCYGLPLFLLCLIVSLVAGRIRWDWSGRAPRPSLTTTRRGLKRIGGHLGED